MKTSLRRFKAHVLRGLGYQDFNSSQAWAIYLEYRSRLPPSFYSFLTCQEFQLACLLLYECRYLAPYCFRNPSELFIAYIILRADKNTQRKCEMPLDTFYRAVWESFFLVLDYQHNTPPISIEAIPAINFEEIELIIDGMDRRVVEWIRKEAWVPRVDKISSQGELLAKLQSRTEFMEYHAELNQAKQVNRSQSSADLLSMKKEQLSTLTRRASTNLDELATPYSPAPLPVIDPLSFMSSNSGATTTHSSLEVSPTGGSLAACTCDYQNSCPESRLSFIHASRQYWLATLSQVFFIWPPPPTSSYDSAFTSDSPRKSSGKGSLNFTSSIVGSSFSRPRPRTNDSSLPNRSTASNHNLVAEIDFLWQCFQTAIWWNNEAEQDLCRRGFDAFLARRRLKRHQLFSQEE